jgi:glycosyltransferase involved in cell wall biosynthesis
MNEWDNRLRVGMFTNVYLPTTNGVVVSVETFRRALTELGHHVYVFGPDSGAIEDRAPYIFRYPALELPLQKYPLTLPVSPYIDHVIRNLKPQILHANHPALLGRVAERKSAELDVPLVFTYHTRYADYSHYADPLPQENVKEFIDHWLASFMTACHQVVVPSESIKDMLKTHYGDSIASHVSVVPTGVETAKFSAYTHQQARQKLGWSPERKTLVSIGRLAKEKNFDLLIRAFARLENKELHLVIMGSGDEKKALESLANELGVAERVEFPGLVPFDEVPIYLAASDLFVFASVTETQGLVTLEAMASGLPVAAVEASGTREAVSPDCSVLTEASDQALAAGIQEMLGRTDSGSVREAAQRRAKEFDVLVQGRAMVEVYKKAQEAHKARSRVLIMSERIKTRWEELLSIFRL